MKEDYFLSDEVLDKITKIINSKNRYNLRESLESILEEEVNKILPTGWRYNFSSKNSGDIKHEIYCDGILIYNL